MSNKERRTEAQNSELKQLSTKELEERLAMGWLASSQEDDEYFDAVAEAMIEKDKEDSCGRFADADETWKKLEESLSTQTILAAAEKTLPPTTKSKRLLRRAASLAAVIAVTFVCLILVQASGLNIFGALGKWTDEVFRFAPPSPADNISIYDTSVLPEIAQVFSENGIPTAFAPKGTMAGMSLEDIWVDTPTNLIVIHMRLLSPDGKEVLYDVISSSSETFHTEMQYQKTEAPVAEYIHNNMRFYVFENTGRLLAAWTNGEYTVRIGGNVDRETMQSIIDSI